MHASQRERHETIKELFHLFLMVQQMGQVIANTSHGAAHDGARELNELLHQARLRIELIHAELPTASHHHRDAEDPMAVARFTTPLGA